MLLSLFACNEDVGRHPEGQGLVEYALIILLVALVAMIGLGLFGSELAATYSDATALLFP